jgi:hypothetical protein
MEISFDTFIIRSGPMKTETINISNSCVIRKMGTSGLREKQEIYNQPFFVEQFAQGVALFFREITDAGTLARNNRTILVGGDPRLGNGDRIRRIAGVLAGNGFRVVVAENGLTTTRPCLMVYGAGGGGGDYSHGQPQSLHRCGNKNQYGKRSAGPGRYGEPHPRAAELHIFL